MRLRALSKQSRVQVGKPHLWVFVLCVSGLGFAAKLSGQMVQYTHTAWSSDSGLGAVFDIQQAPNGYLWLTTSKGVVRFDGVRFQSAGEATNGAVRDNDIDSVFVSASGGVWLTTRSAGLILWKEGVLTTFSDRRCTPALKVGGMAEDADGSLWIQASAGLSHMSGSICWQEGKESGYPGGFAAGLMVDREGTLWVKTPAGPLLFLRKGQSRFQLSQYGTGPTSDWAFVHQAPNGSIWLSDDHGLRRVKEETGSPTIVSPLTKTTRENIRPGNFTFDSDGTLWVATVRGVERLENPERWQAIPAAASFPRQSLTVKDGLSSDAIWKIFVDRKGTIWIGTNSGLDRLRRNIFTKLSLPHTQENQFSVATGDHGSVWFGNKNLPLTHIDADGKVTRFAKTGQAICLRRDWHGAVWSAGEGDAHLWHSSRAGLVPLHYPKESLEAIASLAVDRNNDVWISTLWANVYHLDHGEWIPQNQTLGKRPGLLGAMTGDDTGNIWFGFSHNVVRWDGAHYSKFPFTDSQLEISVTTMAVRGEHVWLGGTAGVELFTRGHFYVMRWVDPSLPGRVSGIVETETGDLWINGFSGVTHVAANALANWLRNPTSAVSAEHFDALDGLPGLSAYRTPEPSVVESREGRLWFATTKGIAWLDPATLEKNRNRQPPPVVVSSAIANGTTYAGSKHLTFPPHTESLQVEYTALSLAMPVRVKFRYQLDRIDKDWQNAGTRRQAFYTNLAPGNYRFHVIACNDDGVWNNQGAFLEFRIQPAWYQTTLFKLLLLVLGLGITFILYLLDRQRYITLLRIRFDERLEERTRLARELHDTLLQTIQGSKLVADHALKNLEDPGKTRTALQRLSQWLDRGVVEGRAALDSLRNSTADTEDLVPALRRAVEACVSGHMQLIFSVKGIPCSVHPVAQDEVLRIGTEAIRNACLHSCSAWLSVELRYGKDLTLSVRDSGRGFDPELLNAGKPGHFGIMGMRERAFHIGARLSLKSSEEQGTCLTLIVPGKVVFRRETMKSLVSAFRLRRSRNGSS
jgi:signal transduction histidine kinase/ligand-binding sensor domain-containing protein